MLERLLVPPDKEETQITRRGDLVTRINSLEEKVDRIIQCVASK